MPAPVRPRTAPGSAALAGVGIDHAEQRRVGDVQISLIDRDLRRIGRIEPGQSITLDGFPALGVETFMFPDAWISQRRQLRPSNENPIRMTTEQSTGSHEFQLFGRREPEPGSNQMLTRHVFKEMPAREDILDARREIADRTSNRIGSCAGTLIRSHWRQDTAGKFSPGGSACSISSLISLLIGRSDKFERLKSSITLTSLFLM